MSHLTATLWAYSWQATADPASTFDSLSEAWKSEQEGLAALLPALSPEDRAALNVRTSAFMKLLEERTDPTAALVGYDMLKAQLEFLEKRHSVTSADAATL